MPSHPTQQKDVVPTVRWASTMTNSHPLRRSSTATAIHRNSHLLRVCDSMAIGNQVVPYTEKFARHAAAAAAAAGGVWRRRAHLKPPYPLAGTETPRSPSSVHIYSDGST